MKPARQAHDADYVPELAVRKSQDGDYHIGVCPSLFYLL
jgi:hypothetical protein